MMDELVTKLAFRLELTKRINRTFNAVNHLHCSLNIFAAFAVCVCLCVYVYICVSLCPFECKTFFVGLHKTKPIEVTGNGNEGKFMEIMRLAARCKNNQLKGACNKG